MTLKTVLSRLLSRPNDLENAERRHYDRYRNAFWTIASNIASRAAALALTLLSVRWTLPYLGTERFGAWMTITAFASILGLADFGISNSLTNRVAQVAASGNGDALRSTISKGLALLCLIGLTLSASLPILASHVAWTALIHLHGTNEESEITRTAQIFGILFGISIVGNGTTRIFAGLQRGFEAHIASLAASLASIPCLAYATTSHADIPTLILCTMGITQLGHLSLLARLWASGHFSPFKMSGALSEAAHFLETAWVFLLIQIGLVVASGSDSLILAHAQGPAAVTQYMVTLRITQIFSQPLAIINAPLWGAYADAKARGDKEFIRITFRRSLHFTLAGSSLGAALLIMAGGFSIREWTHDSTLISLPLIATMSIWLITESCGNSIGVLLNGLGLLRMQLLLILTYIAIALPAKLFGASSFGPTGMMLAGVMSYVLVFGLGYGLAYRETITTSMR